MRLAAEVVNTASVRFEVHELIASWQLAGVTNAVRRRQLPSMGGGILSGVRAATKIVHDARRAIEVARLGAGGQHARLGTGGGCHWLFVDAPKGLQLQPKLRQLNQVCDQQTNHQNYFELFQFSLP